MADEVKDSLQEESQLPLQNNVHKNSQDEIQNPLPNEVKQSWFSCLTHPIKTINSWGDKKVSWLFIIIASSVFGIDSVLSDAYLKSYGEHYEFNFILFMAIVGGPIKGIISLMIGSIIILLLGKLFRGKATLNQAFNVNVISAFPFIFLLPIWLLEIFIFGENIFKESLYTSAEDLQKAPLLIGLSFLELLIAGWSMIVFVSIFCFVNQFKLMKKVFYILAYFYLFVTLIYFIVNSYELFSILKNAGITEQEEEAYESVNNDETNKAVLVSLIGKILENVNIDSNDTIEYIDLGNTYYESGQYEEALDAYLKATELGVTEDTAYVYYNIGVTYYDLERYTDSIFNFKQYLEYTPDDLDANWYMVNAFGNTGNVKLELEYLDKIIELDSSIDGPLYKGDLLTYYGNYEEALTIYEEVIESFPQHPEGYYGKARMLSFWNQPDEAVSNLQKAFEIDSSFTEFALEDPMLHPIRETQVFKEFISNFATSDIGTY